MGLVERDAEPQAGELGHGATSRGFAQAAMHAGSKYEAGAVICQKYRLEVMLGEGGMGSVWRATNLQLDCSVAIKLIRDGIDREELRLRLTLEARAAAKLAHPGIVRVFDVGETETGDPFIVMELLSGETLSQVSSDTALSPVRAVQLLLPIAEALSVAHASGIVHRDLKPDNVFIVEEDGRVQPKLLDFGIAKLTGTGDRAGGVTQAGTLLGTPDYMSPEGARGQTDLDARADVWSFCVVLYEQVADALPFLGNNPYAMLRAIVEDDPIPLRPEFVGAADLWQIVQRGLANDRRERFQSMAELGRALAIWLRSQGVQDDACGLSLDVKWLRSVDSSRSASGAPWAQQAASNAGERRLSVRPRAMWPLTIALLALVIGGVWSTTGSARLRERAERPAAATDTASHSVPSVAAPFAVAGETPAPAVVRIAPKPGPVAHRTPSFPVPRANPPAAANSQPASRREVRHDPIDLIAPY